MAQLSRVQMHPSVYSVCISHALTNEQEEVAGVLVGRWERDLGSAGTRKHVAIVSEFVAMPRNDRQKDRVEINSVDLVQVQNQVHARDPRLSVIGWFHSHPHITVLPSHVDVKTQRQYQQLDSRFFGIIVSCFDTKLPGETIQFETIAFQSESDQDYVEISIEVIENNLTVAELRSEASLRTAIDALVREERMLMEKYIHPTSETQNLYTAATFQKAMSKIIEYHIDPTIERLNGRIKEREKYLHTLKHETSAMETEL